MKHFFTLISFLLAGFSAAAQTSRNRNKTIAPYRNTYQRMATGALAAFGFEIRNGALWAYGDNTFRQLGDGTTVTKSEPVQIGTATNWVSVSCGASHAVGICSDGTMWAWGHNNQGQLGIGMTPFSATPVQVGTAANWVTAACGVEHTLAISADGRLWGFGTNVEGQLGVGSAIFQVYSPMQVGTADNWVAIACGLRCSMAISADGKLWGFGDNYFGQIGIPAPSADVPVQVGTATHWTQVDCGRHHSMAISSDGKLWATGENTAGQLGIGTNSDAGLFTQVGSATHWTRVACGSYHTAALSADGSLWTWGDNSIYQFGDNTTTSSNVPVQTGTFANWSSLAAGAFHTTATTGDGRLWAWGSNGYGQLGDGTTGPRPGPFNTQTTLPQWLNITAGEGHCVAMKGDATLWSWGRNDMGQLGDGTSGFSSGKGVPIQVGPANWAGVSCGSYHTVAIRSDGRLYAWGNNSYGQLGNGTTLNANVAGQVGTSAAWVSAACGLYHTIALKSDGTLWAWGLNNYGQLGDGTLIDKALPVQIGNATTWVSIACGYNYTMALKSDGTLWGWGFNTYGQLGDGTNTDKAAPVQIGIATNWRSIACGTTHTAAVSSNGRLWTWGLNNHGQLGNGSLMNTNTPAQAGTADNWIGVAAGYYHTMGLAANGRVWVWGYNGEGELGDGTTVSKSVPVMIGDQANVVALPVSSRFSYHSAIIKVGRANVCLTGYNSDSQLADNTTNNSSGFNCSNNVCSRYVLAGGAETYTQPVGGTGYRTDFQSNCGLSASVIRNAGSLFNAATVKVWVEPTVPVYLGSPYVARHYEVTPATNASTSSGTVILYYTQADFTAYNAAPGHGPDLPVDSEDLAGDKANLRITKRGGASFDATGLQGSYTGPATVLIPAGVVWDTAASVWKVTLTVNGFSGFFVSTTGTPLPIGLTAFGAQKEDALRNRVSWKTAVETPGTLFTVERSSDGGTFRAIGIENGRAAKGADYVYLDVQPLPDVNYYRLKIAGPDGGPAYSAIAIVRGDRSSGSVTLSPVPAGNTLTVTNTNSALDGQTVTVWNMEGREVSRFVLRDISVLDVSGWAPGVYSMKLPDGGVMRVVKQ